MLCGARSLCTKPDNKRCEESQEKNRNEIKYFRSENESQWSQEKGIPKNVFFQMYFLCQKFRKSWLDENIFKGWLRMTIKLGVKFVIFRLNIIDIIYQGMSSHIDNVNSVNIEIDISQ